MSKDQIRNWLNTVFLETAFDEEERGMLCSLCSDTETNTSDKVGLLGYDQANTLYKNNSERIKKGTEVSLSRGLIKNSDDQGWWWLSSSDADNPDCVFRVYSNGRIGFDTDYDNECIGVVPVIVVRID